MAVELFYKKYENPSSEHHLFILHGLFGMLDNWHRIAKKLSEYCNVYAIDLRNHGKSPHVDEMSLELMSDDIRHLVDSLQLEQVIILGHSMGGKVAMAFANHYPELVEKLIVVDIAPREYKAGHDRYFEAFKELDFSSFQSRSEADAALAERESNAGIRQFLLKNLDRNQEGGYRLKLNIQSIDRFYPDLLQALDFHWIISTPALFIRGSESQYISDADYHALTETFTDASLVTIDGAGHWVHADRPEEFTEIVLEFIRE